MMKLLEIEKNENGPMPCAGEADVEGKNIKSRNTWLHDERGTQEGDIYHIVMWLYSC